MRTCLLLILFLTGSLTYAQDSQTSRERETDLFGGPPPVDKPTQPTSPALQLGKMVRDAFESGEVHDNPLQIGGLFYQRLDVTGEKGVSTSDTPLSAPLQFDLFMDVRPSDRVRGFVDERLLYDSTRDAYSNPTKGTASSSLQYSSGASAPTSLSGGTSRAPNNPQTVLDQAWLKFDMERTVFVTVGKQHLKWGTSKFWNPTDFLNTQIRDPLLPYDLRLGNTMVKFDIPLEAERMNLYAITLLDNPQAASTLGQLGEALRVEKIVGKAEIGMDAVFRGGVTPTYGADFSAPLGPLDIYGEASYLTGSATPHYRQVSAIAAGSDVSSIYTARYLEGPIYQVSGGLNYSFGWKENRLATVGVEYFYNDQGYDNSKAYPVMILKGNYQPFYTGRNYAAFYINAEGPDAAKHTSYALSTLANLSDSSYISRLDFTWQFLTYLTFNAYFDQHYGEKGGEFNFGLDTPALTYQGSPIAAIHVPQSLWDLGMSLRLSF